MQDNITLYHMTYCPYCVRVRRAANKLGIELNLIDINDHPEARGMLLQERQRATVPVIEYTVNGQRQLMGESKDIINYFKQIA